MDAGLQTLVTPPAAVRTSGDAVVRPPEAARPKAPAQTGPSAATSSRLEIQQDADTKSLIYRMIDTATGAVTAQTPSDARLKLRAYIDHVVASARPRPSLDSIA